MKAIQIVENKLAICEIPEPQPQAGEVLVKLSAVALNHRDQWIRAGKYPNIVFNTTLGSDGCGQVMALGKGASKKWLNKTVVINPNVNWGDDQRIQSSSYQVLGMPTAGTLAEYISLPQDRVEEKPKHLTDTEAAALPLAGLTAYRALFHHGELQKGQKVLITGIGGGVSQMAFLWAQAKGAQVSVTSGQPEKLEKMKELGAIQGYNYKGEWAREAAKQGESYDLIVDSTGGPQLNSLIKLARPAGRIVFYGATTGLPPKIDLYRMFWNQVTLQGSTMGSDKEFVEMIAFAAKHKLVPMIDSVRPFSEALDAFNRMEQSQQFGKLVLSLT